jgi:alpha-1,6-mannosyltransferase
MPGDATTIPLQDGPLGGARHRQWRRDSAAWSGAGARAKVGALAMVAIVALGLLVVAMAANRPSLLSPTTHVDFFPHWMAGPLGGLMPGLSGNSTTLKYWFSGAIVLMYVSYLVTLRCAPQLPVRWVLGAILAVHVVFVLAPPLALTDVFNYINYGRMEVVHHLNPYATIPILEPHDDPSYNLSNWHQLLSPYGPLFTLLTFVVVPLGVAGSFWALKVLLAAASLTTLFFVWKCARLLGRDPLVAVALVGLNPIVLVWGLGGEHNDALMLLCVVVGFYLLLRSRAAREAHAEAPAGGMRGWLLPLSLPEIGAGAAFVVAIAIKASGAVLLPVVLVGLARTPRALVQALIGMAAAAVVVGAASLLAFGLHIPDLSTQSRLITSESVPNLIGLAVGAGGETQTLHTLMTVVLLASVAWCCWFAWSARRPAADRTITASAWASVALLMTLSWVLPWYVLWALPLAALSSSRRLRTAVLAVGVYLIIAWAPASGLLWNAIGFHPEKTSLGRLHQRIVKELLN